MGSFDWICDTFKGFHGLSNVTVPLFGQNTTLWTNSQRIKGNLVFTYWIKNHSTGLDSGALHGHKLSANVPLKFLNNWGKKTINRKGDSYEPIITLTNNLRLKSDFILQRI